MIDHKLWLSFEQALTPSDIEDIVKRLSFLRDILDDAITQFDVEDVRSELDLNLHVYLNSPQSSGKESTSPWLIHDRWLHHNDEGVGLDEFLKKKLEVAFIQTNLDLRHQLEIFWDCLNSYEMIHKEVDAVVWLTFLDHMASRIIFQIGHSRLYKIFSSVKVNDLNSER